MQISMYTHILCCALHSHPTHILRCALHSHHMVCIALTSYSHPTHILLTSYGVHCTHILLTSYAVHCTHILLTPLLCITLTSYSHPYGVHCTHILLTSYGVHCTHILCCACGANDESTHTARRRAAILSSAATCRATRRSTGLRLCGFLSRSFSSPRILFCLSSRSSGSTRPALPSGLSLSDARQ